MEMLGDRKFVEIPGEKTHELPPLLVKTAPSVRHLDKVVSMANGIIDSEDLIPTTPLDVLAGEEQAERRKMDLAFTMVDQYLSFVRAWHWGDAICEWIRQCEITFDQRPELRPLLRVDVWPRAGRSSFVDLLHDKAVTSNALDDRTNIDLARAVGLRITFRQPPPLRCFSDQFLFYLNGSLAQTAYQTWAQMNPPISSLPPERFTFQVLKLSLD
jgi:hypothetical protein